MVFTSVLDYIITHENFGKGLQALKYATIGATLLYLANSDFHLMGVREIRNLYSFEYEGKPAVVKQDNVRFGQDLTYVVLDKGDIVYAGKFTTDDGKVVKVGGNNDRLFNNKFSVFDK